jgi:general secretion pathway protein A
MYEDFYGFVQPPFSLTPDPRFLYRSESHDVALQQVWQAIRRKEGFIVLTGDIGTGKTTLCRTLLEQFDQTTFTALMLNPFLSVEELLREMLLSFGVVSKEATRSGRLSSASKHELVRTLHDFLLSLVPLHGSAVLIIDEAQHLSTEVLEEIRVLSNLETNDQKLLQIVIVGQLNLLDVLNKAELRQLDQRISIRCSLKPLTREEVEAYVTHRLFVARGSTPVSFTPRAFDLVHSLSGGVPRIINLVCDRALMVGCEKQTNHITEEHVVAAAAKLGLEVPKESIKTERTVARPLAAPSRRGVFAMAAVAALAAIVVAGLWLFGNPLAQLRSADLPPPAKVVRPLPPIVEPGAPPSGAAAPIVPPPVPGSFSILVGTYNNFKQSEAVEAQLRALKVEPYEIDIEIEPGDVRRRVLIGRFPSRAEAEAVRQKLGEAFRTSVVILGIRERNRYQLLDTDF